MNQIDVSIIVPIYNAVAYLQKCLDSILAQTKNNIQVVLVNDGSSDGSETIIEDYASRYQQIIVVAQENQGLTKARIAGYQAAKGRYIGWVDADDFIQPHMYETLYALAESEQAELVYCNYEFYPDKVATKVKWFKEYHGTRDWHFIDKNTSFWNKLFRKDLLDRVDICSLLNQYGEYSTIVPMLEAKKIGFTRDELYVYRVGHNSMSGGSFQGKVQHYVTGAKTSKNLIHMIKGRSYEGELKDYFDYRYIYTLLLVVTVSAMNMDRENYEQAQKELRRMHYSTNPLLGKIVREHYGFCKAFVVTKVLPLQYRLAVLITKLTIQR